MYELNQLQPENKFLSAVDIHYLSKNSNCVIRYHCIVVNNYNKGILNWDILVTWNFTAVNSKIYDRCLTQGIKILMPAIFMK